MNIKNTKTLLLFIIILLILFAFIIYDSYVIEEERFQEYFTDDIYDAKVNSKYIHDEIQNIRQVKFNVDVPLNRYIVESTTPPASY